MCVKFQYILQSIVFEGKNISECTKPSSTTKAQKRFNVDFLNEARQSLNIFP